MSRGADALVRPELLVWARRSAGLEIAEAARKAQVRPEHLESWECGVCEHGQQAYEGALLPYLTSIVTDVLTLTYSLRM